jgi:dolichol kinase
MLGLAAGLTALYVGLDAARLVWPAWNRRVFGRLTWILRTRETERLTGASYSLAALVVCVWAFAPVVVAAAFLYHSIGDSAAGWVGRRWGRHRVGGKSLEGTAAFVAAGSAACWPLVGGLPAIAGALLSGLAELLAPVDDNLSVPILGGVGVTLVEHLAGRG